MHLKKYETWEIVERKEDKKLVGCGWINNIKTSQMTLLTVIRTE